MGRSPPPPVGAGCVAVGQGNNGYRCTITRFKRKNELLLQLDFVKFPIGQKFSKKSAWLIAEFDVRLIRLSLRFGDFERAFKLLESFVFAMWPPRRFGGGAGILLKSLANTEVAGSQESAAFCVFGGFHPRS